MDGIGNLYAGGSFTSTVNVAASHSARWDGTIWSALGSGTDEQVRSLAVDSRNVFAGGDFTMAGGNVSPHFARYSNIIAPGVLDFTRQGEPNARIQFTEFDFSRNYKPLSGSSLVKIKLTSLPDHGVLMLGADYLSVNQEIAAADLAQLSYAPANDWTGTTRFGWTASDGTQYAPDEASVTLVVAVLQRSYCPLIGR